MVLCCIVNLCSKLLYWYTVDFAYSVFYMTFSLSVIQKEKRNKFLALTMAMKHANLYWLIVTAHD